MIDENDMKVKLNSYSVIETTIKAFKSFKTEFILLCILAAFDKMIEPPFIQNAS